MPLDAHTRADMEARFGESFADVRVRNDEQAHRSAASLDAKAYTIGNEITFSAGRYAPHAREGKRLLAHELAHVVQQRRGGAAPPFASDAPHEAAADHAAAEIAGGVSCVQVSGATGVGIACDLEDDKKNSSSRAPQFAPEDMTRAFEQTPQYWLTHTPDLESKSALQLRDEANRIEEWRQRQTSSNADMDRLIEVRDQFRVAAQAKEKRAQRRPRKRLTKTAPTEPPAKPSSLLSSVSLNDPTAVARKYDDVVEYLQHDGIPGAERKQYLRELEELKPGAQAYLARRTGTRHAEAVTAALDARDANGEAQFVESMRRIDSIKPLEGAPDTYYFMHGRERIVLTKAMVDAIHAQALKSLESAANGITSANDEVRADYDEFVDRTYEKHKYVGFISMMRSGENPLDWEDSLMGIIRASNSQWQTFRAEDLSARDPWRGERAALAPLAEHIANSERLTGVAQNYLDYKEGQVLEGTVGAIRYLSRLKAAGNMAASVAFTPFGAGVYSALESTLVQGAEIAYDQRSGFDFVGIGADAVTSYLSSKITNGVMGLGKNAPAAVRLGLFVVGDRAGASANAAMRLSFDKARGRDVSTDQILHAAWEEGTDYKQALLNLLMVGVGHVAHSGPKPKRPGAVHEGGAVPPAELPAQSLAAPEATSVIEISPDVIPIKQDQPPPISAASKKLNSLLERQPADQVGSITPLRKPAKQSEPSQANEQQIPVQMELQEGIAVGQTHGADGGGSALPSVPTMSAANGNRVGKADVGRVSSGARDPSIGKSPTQPVSPAEASQQRSAADIESRLNELGKLELPESLAAPAGEAIAKIRERAAQDPAAAKRLLTALEGHLEDANVTLPGEKIDPRTREMLGGGREASDEMRAHPDEMQEMPIRANERYDWKVSEEEASVLQAEFPELPAQGWRTQRPVVRRPNGQVEIIDRGRTPRGATVPERYHPGDATHPPVSIEVKNWTVDDVAVADDPFLMRDFLAKTGEQAQRRAKVLPPNTEHYVIIDLRGQQVSKATQEGIRRDLEVSSNGVLSGDHIRFLTNYFSD
ncbi:MAG TPA: DUF4157 domain-containing protein [Steroidobacteraceae bacterium]|nr:DUF4157 domain-containing protein [Steroidobacteraceae bacterium]